MNAKTIWLMSSLFLCAGIIHSQDDVDSANKAGQYIKDAKNLNREMTQRRIASARTSATSPDGNRIVKIHDDGGLSISSSRTGEKLLTLETHGKAIKSAAFSPRGIFIFGKDSAGNTFFWNSRNGGELTLKGHTAAIRSFDISPDDRRFATVSDRTISIFSWERGERLLTLEGHEKAVKSVAFSPDGMRIVTASDDLTAMIWDVRTGELLGRLEHLHPIDTAAFNPQGKCVITKGAGHTLFWNAQTGEQTTAASCSP